MMLTPRWLVLMLALLASCARYAGPSRGVAGRGAGDDWKQVTNIELVRQEASNDCGAAAAAMVLTHWGSPTSLEELQTDLPATKGGVRAHELRDALLKRGLQAFVIEGTMADLEYEIAQGRPVIVGTLKSLKNGQRVHHFEVVVAIQRERQLIMTLDPSLGWRKFSYAGFESEWLGSAHTTIVALPPEPSI